VKAAKKKPLGTPEKRKKEIIRKKSAKKHFINH
jgi:hypothetical protein